MEIDTYSGLADTCHHIAKRCQCVACMHLHPHLRSAALMPTRVHTRPLRVVSGAVPCSLQRHRAPHTSDLPPTLVTPCSTAQELSATFASNSSSTPLLASHWSLLMHALSGLFCSSIHLLATPDMFTLHSPTQPSHHGFTFTCPAPHLNGNACEEGGEEGQCGEQHDSQDGGPADGDGSCGGSDSSSSSGSSGNWRHAGPGTQRAGATGGAKGQAGGGTVVLHSWLPRESVCGENLSPWLKLLPCRDQAGLAQLLSQRGNLYRTRNCGERCGVCGVHVSVGCGFPNWPAAQNVPCAMRNDKCMVCRFLQWAQAVWIVGCVLVWGCGKCGL